VEGVDGGATGSGLCVVGNLAGAPGSGLCAVGNLGFPSVADPEEELVGVEVELPGEGLLSVEVVPVACKPADPPELDDEVTGFAAIGVGALFTVLPLSVVPIYEPGGMVPVGALVLITGRAGTLTPVPLSVVPMYEPGGRVGLPMYEPGGKLPVGASVPM
jgi:hypothetical protein